MQNRFYIIPILFLLIVFGIEPDATAQNADSKPNLELEFSVTGGFYDSPVMLELYSPGATIYYTTDGSDPGHTSTIYKGVMQINKTAVIRAMAVREHHISHTIAHTYFINEPATTFPVISIAIHPAVLFHPDKGLYMKGPNVVDSLWKKDGANFWSKKEVLVNVEIYETDKKCAFNSPAGFRLFGGMSRLFPQKSMTLVARDRIGKKRIKHPIFGEDGKKKYKFLVLRNSGSDWGKSHFRDGLMTSLLNDWDIEKQDYRPSHVYLNGTYWGIYNIREKVNRYFIEAHNDIDNDSIDLIEHRFTRKRGSTLHYGKMINFLERHTLKQPENYAYLQSQMEVDNFMNYQIAQIYFDNKDAGGNIKFWRPQRPDGRWRWIMYDTDWGFGLHDANAYRSNSLAFHTEANGPGWPNPPWSTFILRKLLENPEFKQEFINRFCDHLNTSFAPDRVSSKIDKFHQQLLPEMPRHLKRWRLSEKVWKLHIDRMLQFALLRPDYIRKYLKEMFDTGEEVAFSASAQGGGVLLINNNIRVEGDWYEGRYFENVPVSLVALPHFGYRFSHWEGLAVSNKINKLFLKLDKQQLYHVKAVFVQDIHPLAGRLVINEVSPNDKKTGDWLELYNGTKKAIDMKDWLLADRKHIYSLPAVTIAPESFLIICEDTAKFRSVFSEVKSPVGNLPFGFNKRKERIALYTSDGASVDSVFYEIHPKDTSYALSLLLPHLNNSDTENWEINEGQGTPGAQNPYYVASLVKAEQELWLRIGVSVGMLLCCGLVLYMKQKRDKKLLEL